MLPELVGESASMRDLTRLIRMVAPRSSTVLIEGETGTGKEVIAKAIHRLSTRSSKSFVVLNCAAIPEALLEAELFGHTRGAFTGAVQSRTGRIETAHGGTLFLDEIATASLAVQEKVLRVIEYGAFERVGGNETLQVDVRVIAATNADLPALAEDGKFRADLLDRLAFDVIALPPLRERRDDIPLLAEHFATRMTAELGRPYFAGFTSRAMGALLGYSWPGNVRELRNVVERSVCRLTRPEERLDAVVLNPFPVTAGAAEGGDIQPEQVGSFQTQIKRHEAHLLQHALHAARFNQKRAAASLGLSYDQFRRLLRAHNLLRSPEVVS